MSSSFKYLANNFLKTTCCTYYMFSHRVYYFSITRDLSFQGTYYLLKIIVCNDAVWNDDDCRDNTQTASGRVKILYCQDKNETLDK